MRATAALTVIVSKWPSQCFASQVQAIVLDRLLVVLEGIHVLLIRVPLYKQATEEFSELRSKYARDKITKQAARLLSKAFRHFLFASLGLAISLCFAA